MLAFFREVYTTIRDSDTIPFLLHYIRTKPQWLRHLFQDATMYQLYAGVLHDLSTPLTVALLSLDTQQVFRDPVLVDTLQQMKGLIQSARSMAWSHCKTYVNLNDVIHNTQTLLRQYASIHGVRIVSYTTEPVHVFGYTLALQQITNNLVLNAIEACQYATTQDKTITIVTASTETNHLLTIHDTGCGLTTKNTKQLFIPGYTTKGFGRGFGLSFVYRLVRHLYKGDITITSSREHGTTVCVRFPKVPAHKLKKNRQSEYQ